MKNVDATIFFKSNSKKIIYKKFNEIIILLDKSKATIFKILTYIYSITNYNLQNSLKFISNIIIFFPYSKRRLQVVEHRWQNYVVPQSKIIF